MVYVDSEATDTYIAINMFDRPLDVEERREKASEDRKIYKKTSNEN